MKNLFTPDWVFPCAVDVPPLFRHEIGGSDIFLQTLVRRGYSYPEKARAFIDPDFYHPCSGFELPGMEKAVKRIISAMQAHEKVGIWGDFDVDGQTSTAVLVSGLRTLGLQVFYHIPVRGPESHGISVPYLEKFLQSGIDLLITCDTGISAKEAIDFASHKGIDVIVTDHHTLPDTLPDAFSLIDPQFLPPGHPLSTLSGVGVAYKLIESIYSECGRIEDVVSFLDLVALGLIADLAILTRDARYLVQKGLQRIRNEPRLSISTILSENEIPPQEVTEDTVSYVIAPRLNAVGRLDDANPMVEFLLTDDPVFARTTYNRIEGFNSKRKLLCDQVFKGAQSQIEQQPKFLEKPLIFLGHPEWPAGVVGIVASRLVNLYHRPVILFNTEDLNNVKGSARSIAGINITEAIHQHEKLLNSFGGHPMAAGLSLSASNFDELRFGLYQTIDEMVHLSNYQPSIEIDLQIDLPSLSFDLVNELGQFAPFGPGNPPILFAARDLEIDSVKFIGRTKEHEELVANDATGNSFRFIWWQAAGIPHPTSRFDLAFSASFSNFRGKPDLRLEWRDFRPSLDESLSVVDKSTRTRIDSIDLRNGIHPENELIRLAENDKTVVFSEGSVNILIFAKNRHELIRSEALAIWTIPPSLDVLAHLLEQVQPRKIVWFARVPEENSLVILLKKIGSLIKNSPLTGNSYVLDTIQAAAACASTEEIVKLVVSWYASRGDITLERVEGSTIRFVRLTHGKDEIETARLQDQIARLHNEVMAFRSYYQKIEDPGLLIPDSLIHRKKPK